MVAVARRPIPRFVPSKTAASKSQILEARLVRKGRPHAERACGHREWVRNPPELMGDRFASSTLFTDPLPLGAVHPLLIAIE